MSKKNPKLSKQSKEEQNDGMGIIWRVISWEEEGGEWEEMVYRSRSIIGRNKIDRGMLRRVEEREEPKNLHAQPIDMN